MRRRDAAPDDIGEVAGDMIENSDINRSVVREGEKRSARADACADDADAIITALFSQPAN